MTLHACMEWVPLIAGGCFTFLLSICMLPDIQNDALSSQCGAQYLVAASCRARANGAATKGQYKADANGRKLGHTESLHEKDYKY